MSEFKVNGKVVEYCGEKLLITHWHIDKQLEVLAWLTKTFGEGIMSLFLEGGDVDDYLPEMEKDSEGAVTEESKNSIGAFVTEIFSKLSPKDYAHYAKYIVADVLHGNKKVDVNKLFRGRLVKLHYLIFEVLQYQYSDFLQENSESQM